MAVLIGFAFLSGVITILSPCILPILPAILSGGVSGGKARPFGIVTGFIASFVLFTLSLSAIVQATGLSPEIPRYFAVVILVLFGIVMIVPALRNRFELGVSGIVARSKGLQTTPVVIGGAQKTAAGTMSAGSVASLPTSAGQGGSQSVETARPKRLVDYSSGLIMGLGLGIVWTPCVGPIMASVISLAVGSKIDAGAVLITIAYALGTAIPMLAVMLGGKALVTKAPWLLKRSDAIQKVFGVLMILVAVAVLFGWERQFQNAVLTAAPGYGSGLTAIEDNEHVRQAIAERNDTSNASGSAAGGTMSVSGGQAAAGAVFSGAGSTRLFGGLTGDYGLAPQLIAEGPWINSPPLDMASLKGKVVVVDFWTYSCVNCVRTLPYLKSWYETYKDQGLVVIGVHSPEFAFERELANVKRASEELGVTWPVVLDNNFAQWRSYGNNYWPAHYFIDATGKVRYFHFGEGEYATSEQVIRKLLAEAGYKPSNAQVLTDDPALSFGNTPETYIGSARAERFESSPALKDGDAVYKAPTALNPNAWSLSGNWYVDPQFSSPNGNGVLELSFDAKDVYMVIAPDAASAGTGKDVAPGAAKPIRILVDGKAAADTVDVKNGMLRVDSSRMYHLLKMDSGGKHLLRIESPKGYRFFAFTFG